MAVIPAKLRADLSRGRVITIDSYHNSHQKNQIHFDKMRIFNLRKSINYNNIHTTTNHIHKVMKYSLPSIFIVLALLISGCAASGASSSDRSSSGGSQITVDNPNVGLDIYVGRLSGVRVQGSGPSANISVRSSSTSSIMGETRPLFIVDGIRAGHDFSRVYRMVTMQNVNSVRIIPPSRATTLYGHEGSNGAIEIIMQN